MVTTCPGWQRHWFTLKGSGGDFGLRTPTCNRCGAPNPKTLTTDDWWMLLEHAPHLVNDPAGTREWLENLKDDVS